MIFVYKYKNNLSSAFRGRLGDELEVDFGELCGLPLDQQVGGGFCLPELTEPPVPVNFTGRLKEMYKKSAKVCPFDKECGVSENQKTKPFPEKKWFYDGMVVKV